MNRAQTQVYVSSRARHGTNLKENCVQPRHQDTIIPIYLVAGDRSLRFALVCGVSIRYRQLENVMEARGVEVGRVGLGISNRTRYSRHSELRRFAWYFALPLTDADPRSALSHRRPEIDRLREAVA